MNQPEVAGIQLRWHRLEPGRPPAGLGLFVPVDPNAVLEDFDDEEFFATDERIPYFATLWPAAETLSRVVMHGPSLAGQQVLDLGCGIGAVGLAAARRGAAVTFLDWEPRALDIVRLSCRAMGLEPAALVAADWRLPPPLGAFDRILAADVLYEKRNLESVAAFLARHLRPQGQALILDPGRELARAFPQVAAGCDLVVTQQPPDPGLSESPDHVQYTVRPGRPLKSGPASGR